MNFPFWKKQALNQDSAIQNSHNIDEQSRPLNETDLLFYKNKFNYIESILNSIPEGVITTNNLGIITFANRRCFEILKTSSSKVLGKPIKEILPLHDQSNKENLTLNLSTIDCEPIIVRVTIDQLDHDNQNNGYIYILKDITQEKALADMKMDFVAISAHQLRTPLTALRGYLNILDETSKEHKGNFSEEEMKYLQRALESSAKLSSLVENLLNISNIEQGSLKLQFSPVLIENVVKNVLNEFMEKAKQKSIQIHFESSDNSLVKVLGDSNLLGEAIGNIIDNAINFNHSHGWVMVNIQTNGSFVNILISDSGKGISQQVYPHLFTKFYCGTADLTQLSDGLGLGLYITKKIVDAHQGQIQVNSLEGKGTTFSITFPLYSEAQKTYISHFGND